MPTRPYSLPLCFTCHLCLPRGSFTKLRLITQTKILYLSAHARKSLFVFFSSQIHVFYLSTIYRYCTITTRGKKRDRIIIIMHNAIFGNYSNTVVLKLCKVSKGHFIVFFCPFMFFYLFIYFYYYHYY